MARRVLLHVGTPKTGTSYLQDVLFRNRPVLDEAGILYPAERFDGQFLAALDLMQLPWGGLEAEAVGAWDQLAGAARGHDGTVVVSHEILAIATAAQVDRAIASLGEGDEAPEVHVVLSVRDLARQVPAEWQENVKHRRAFTYARFLEEILDPERSSSVASWFWGVQEIPWILDRWGRGLPPEQVHLITVPPRGAPPDLLWQRFCSVFGLDGLDLDLDVERVNPSLGVPESALLRRINRKVAAKLPAEHYRPLVREVLAHQTLSQRRESPRLGLPPDLVPWAEELSRSWVAEITARGYDVVGDLEELVGGAPGPWVDPAHPRLRDLNEAALAAIEALLLEGARMRDEEQRLRDELDETRRELDRSYLRPTYRARRKVVTVLDTSPAGRRVHGAYRRVLRRGG